MGLWRNLKTIIDVAHRVDELEEQWTEVRMHLADQLDKLDRLMRRLTLRATRSTDPPPEPIVGPPTTKDQLREVARARGIIR